MFWRASARWRWPTSSTNLCTGLNARASLRFSTIARKCLNAMVLRPLSYASRWTTMSCSVKWLPARAWRCCPILSAPCAWMVWCIGNWCRETNWQPSWAWPGLPTATILPCHCCVNWRRSISSVQSDARRATILPSYFHLANTMTFTISDAAYGTDTPAAKEAMYADLRSQLQGLLAGESDFIANTANFSSLVFNTMPGLNWAGFYFLKGDELVLGPFQGKPACIRIKKGRGVCGTTVVEGKSIVVADVHAFPGHIACDVNSRSELVVPVRGVDGEIVGVFDLDSPLPNRFYQTDADGIEALVKILEATLA